MIHLPFAWAAALRRLINSASPYAGSAGCVGLVGPRGLQGPGLALLLELDQIRAAQGRGLWLERLVVHIGAVLIEDIVQADCRLVVGGGEARVDRDHVGE